jgi:hypothetical protein
VTAEAMRNVRMIFSFVGPVQGEGLSPIRCGESADAT